MTFTYRSEFGSSIRYYNNFDLFVFFIIFCRMQQFRPHLSTYLKSVNTLVDIFRSIYNKSTSLKTYNSCGLSAMNILYLYVVSVASGLRMFSPNSARLSKNIRSHVVVYVKKISLRYMSRLDHLVCEGNISKIQLMSTYQHEEVACRMHGTLSMVDMHYMAPPVAAVVAPPGCHIPSSALPPRRRCRCRRRLWSVMHVDRQVRSARATCNFLVLLCRHHPDFFCDVPFTHNAVKVRYITERLIFAVNDNFTRYVF